MLTHKIFLIRSFTFQQLTDFYSFITFWYSNWILYRIIKKWMLTSIQKRMKRKRFLVFFRNDWTRPLEFINSIVLNTKPIEWFVVTETVKVYIFFLLHPSSSCLCTCCKVAKTFLITLEHFYLTKKWMFLLVLHRLLLLRLH
jgi:hypothetical protein